MNEFSQYVKIIGKGKRAGNYLSQAQAYSAYKLLLGGKAQPEQVGAFLMLLRVREESSEELAGFVLACREHTLAGFSQLDVDLDIGCYAGKRRHLPWFILSIIALAQTGKRIFIHGSQEPDSQRLYVPQAFKELNIPIAHSLIDAKTHLAQFGFAYTDLKNCNPKLDDLLQMRALFALRSSANTLARILNPSAAPHSFHGVFHREFDARHIEIAQLIGDKNVSCLRGEGGEVEINPERPVTQHLLKNGQALRLDFPALLDKKQIKPRELNCAQLEQLWLGELDFEYATQAVIGTIASILTLLEPITSEQALSCATEIWHSRTSKPFAQLFA
ncbi:glycosyl transferase family protein [Psychrobium sp. nBUS_13]|uniref:glycosyl transferase family protein n=1 Tax=Psychrobium sp. nBUS_13 TaxID=3395319 RepID=UPI003EBABA87